MTEGPVKIVLSYKEVDKHHIWMRPYLDKEGYELLYYSSIGWVPLCWCGKHNMPPRHDEPVIDDCRDSIEHDIHERPPIRHEELPCGCK